MLLLLLVLCGCSSVPCTSLTLPDCDRVTTRLYETEEHGLPAPAVSAVELAVLDHVARTRSERGKDLFVSVRSALPHPAEIDFVGVCSTLPPPPEGVYADPGQAILQALQRRGHAVLPVSAATVPDPVSGPDGRLACPPITNHTTGRLGVLFCVELAAVVDRGSVLVGMETRTSHSGGDQEYAVVRNAEGGWQVEEPLAHVPAARQGELFLFGLGYLLATERQAQGPDSPTDGARFVGVADRRSPGGYAAPPGAVMQALRQAGHAVLPCSQARLPDGDERDPRDPRRLRGVENAATGGEGCLYYVAVRSAFSHGLAVIEVGRFEGPLAGGRQCLLVRRRDGEWEIVRELWGAVS